MLRKYLIVDEHRRKALLLGLYRDPNGQEWADIYRLLDDVSGRAAAGGKGSR